ncbi:DUF1127 domain-containing protein [Roseovarius sp. D0-M9]|uniref:DUF1127 domain-containing protein n=1 Tax=Roseovarius sp. D0-M9 TaxID=3127117 RepID=UPI00300F8DAC
MKDTQSLQQLGGDFLGTRMVFQQCVGSIRAAIGRRRLYYKTMRELSALPDRDLSELGIPRSHITRLAWETAYGS